MKIRLIAIDMDGTLLDSRKRLPEGFETWVLDHPEIKVVAASGRQYYTLKDMFPLAGESMLYSAENGGLVFDRGKNIFRDAMKREDVEDCLSLAEKIPGITPILCAVKSAYMRHASANVEAQGHMYYHHLTFLSDLSRCPGIDQAVKVAFYIDEGRAGDVISQIRLSERVRPAVSGTDWIDVNNRTVNKGSGIRLLQERYRISREESMAFGDYMNDYAMLRACEESYAMANACPELKAIAKYETASNDDDGVMRILRQI